MQTANLPGRKPAQFVGDYISHDYYQYLTDGFNQKHPTEQKSVFIAKELILETLATCPNVSGLRFIYGLKEGDEGSSRTIILMACNDTLTDKALLHLMQAQKDYLTCDGEKVSIGQCGEMLNRYVNRMCALMPEEQRKEMPRSCFFGINILKVLLNQKDCAGILYHFGYDPTGEYLPLCYNAVMEAVGNDHQSLHAYVDHGSLCPPNCTPPIIPEEWILGNVVD